ncbi:hypothetical protein CUJ83_06410 [Methanocella sp. CWC-04]|uniref:Uncharacterized protein n=1 Tax=Methanooceanicella nereidis TaxID=2052831 RepID=A0AAP2RBQ5_9EURY|nr:DNA alkylation repair protein [Methanocella sp. CWC-04]MCD1294631.1 hypothetical protein [Methanocella sp. CWC-04]
MTGSGKGKNNDNNELQAILEEIRAFCRENADGEQAAKYARYFKEGYDAYGISQSVRDEYKTNFLD